MTDAERINEKAFERSREIASAVDNDPRVLAARRATARAEHAATQEALAPEGMLTEHFETDRTGRKISRFTGDPEACWAPFKMPSQRVTRLAPPPKY
jgi:hypothetical protein